MSSTDRPNKEQRKASANRHFVPGDKSVAIRSEIEKAQTAMRAKSERLRALRVARDLADSVKAAEAPPVVKASKRKSSAPA
jgi:hypothetical protein